MHTLIYVHVHMYDHWNMSQFTVSITAMALFVTSDWRATHRDFYPLTLQYTE